MNDENQEEVTDTSEVTESAEVETEEESPEATETTEKSDSEPETSEDDEKPPEKDAKRNRGAERRIKQQNRENHRLRDELAAKEQQLLELKGEAPQQPSRDEYSSEEDYVDAVIEFREKSKEIQSRQISEHAEKIEFAARRDNVMEDAEDLIENFDSSKFDNVPITENMATAIVNSDEGAELVAYFYENPEEADRISGLPAGRQQAAVGRLEAKLALDPAAEKSKAPKPIKPVKGTKSVKGGYRPNMTDKEYAAWRNKSKS